MARAFSGSESESALRAYLVLIGRAADGQIVTYGQLSQQIKRGGPNLLAQPLNLLTHWCQAHGLPTLTSIVVEQATGLPAPGFGSVTRSEIATTALDLSPEPGLHATFARDHEYKRNGTVSLLAGIDLLSQHLRKGDSWWQSGF